MSVWAPGPPGCWSRGDTEAEAFGTVQDAIAEYLAAWGKLLHGADVREIEVAAWRADGPHSRRQ